MVQVLQQFKIFVLRKGLPKGDEEGIPQRRLLHLVMHLVQVNGDGAKVDIQVSISMLKFHPWVWAT